MEKINNILDKVFSRVDKNIDGMVTLQEKLTSIPAIDPDSGGDGEIKKGEMLIEYLKQFGIKDIKTIFAPDSRVPFGKRPNIIATIPGTNPDLNFWIMTHLDIVPPGEISLWNSPPYEMQNVNGKLIGRGVEDNQQGMVASIYGIISILEAGFKPYHTVKLLFVADEEVGCEYGIKYLLKNHDLFNKKDFFLVPDMGSEDGSIMEIAEKSICWLKFKTVGKQCHASTPHMGNNAFLAGSELVLKLNELNNIFSKKDELFEPSYSTFSPTKKVSNVPNVNSIPGDDVFYLDCRILPSLSLDTVKNKINEMIAEVEKKHNVTIKYSVSQELKSSSTPKDAAVVISLKNAIKKAYNITGKEMGVGGGTVAAHLRNAGYNAVVWSKLDGTAHMPNEYCIIKNLAGDAKVMASIMMGI